MKPTDCFVSTAKALISRIKLRRTAPKARRRFLMDCTGTTAIEFAMISVPFIGLLGAIFETGSLYFRNAQLQMATETASRALLTHSIATAPSNQDFIKNYVCTWQTSGTVKAGTLSKMFDCSKLMVDVKNMQGTWSTVDGSGADIYTNPPVATANMTLPPPGAIAVVRIVYPMKSIFNILGGGVFKGQTITPTRSGYVPWQGSTAYMLVGMAAFRVEP